MMRSFDLRTVVLVAYELPTEEHLGVRYVAQALIEAGFTVRLLKLNGPGDLVAVANEILAIAPGLVGFSMSDNQAAALQLSLIAYLRARGYQGRLVAGGALATVARHELLAKHEGLSAIIRREGERPLVLLAQAVREGAPFEQVPGVTTRAGDGPAFIETCVLPVARPYRDALPRLLGVPMARVMASRGCSGHCAYCGSAAVRHDAATEARRAGYSLEQIREQGMSSQRHRSITDLADELSELYHDQGVRFFRFIDDHLLGPDESRALALLQGLSRELEARGVARAAFSLMVEPSVVTAAVADAMVALGVVRVLVGVEALTETGLHAIGRNSNRLEGNRAAVKRLHERGIAVFYNSIFLHPESTPASIRAELTALPFVSGVAFDVLPLLVFPGTGLYSRLERDGKLLGSMMACDYVIANVTVSLLRSLLHGMARQLPLLAESSLLAHEVAALDSLSRRLGQGGLSARKRQALHALIDELGALRQSLLTTLLERAEQGFAQSDPVQWLKQLVLTARPRLMALTTQFEAIKRTLSQPNVSNRDGARTFTAAALTAGFIAMVPGCGGDLVDDGATQTPGVNPSPSNGGAGGSVSTTGSAVPQGGATVAQGGATAVGVTTLPTYLSTSCDENTHEAIANRLSGLTSSACSFYPDCDFSALLRLNEAGSIVDVSLPAEYAYMTDAEWSELRACFLKALSQERYPCLTDGFAWTAPCVLLIL